MIERGQGKRRYKDLLSDRFDQILFFGFAVAGAVAIWTMKWLGFSQTLVTAVPVLLMFLYAGLAVATKRYRLREDRIGDNVYYLGFLFTLVSLAYALHVYDPSGGGATAIITNFGIAIFTTILGLAGRVFFAQMREDPIEYEQEARLTLAEASNELRAQLFGIATDVATFKRAMLQITEEGIKDVSETAKASMTENVEQFANVAKVVVDKVQEAFQAFTDHSGQLNAIAAKTVTSLHDLFERIEGIEASPELVAAKLDPVIATLAEVAEEAMRRNRNQTNDLKRLKEVIDLSVTSGEGLRKTLADADEEFKTRLGDFGVGLKQAGKDAAGFVESLRNAASAFEEQLSTNRIASADLVAGFQAQQVALSGVRQSVESDLQSIAQLRKDIALMASQSTEALYLVQSSLVSLTKIMVEELSARGTT